MKVEQLRLLTSEPYINDQVLNIYAIEITYEDHVSNRLGTIFDHYHSEPFVGISTEILLCIIKA